MCHVFYSGYSMRVEAMGLVCGVGVNDVKGSWSTREYSIWRNMMNRCYSSNSIIITPTYSQCYTSDNFKLFSYFSTWCNDQPQFHLDGWELDKDVLVKGNPVYSEAMCVFVPREINSLLTKRQRFRGEHPIGVNYDSKRRKFRACVSKSGTIKNLGYFDCPDSAFNKYKMEKEKIIKQLAEKYKGQLDNRAYNALVSYVVEKTD